MSSLNSDVKSITKHLSKKQKDFDSVMTLIRDIVRESAQAITLLHNNELKKAEKTISNASKLTDKLKKFDSTFGYHAKQAYQEYAEAKIFSEIKLNHEIPSCKKVGVEQESYLNGTYGCGWRTQKGNT